MTRQPWVSRATPHFVLMRWSVRRLTAMQRKYIAMYFGEDVVSALG